MKNSLLLAISTILAALTVTNSAQASSLCSVSEHFSTKSNPEAGCESYDYLLYFATSCDGGKLTTTKPTIYIPACRNRQYAPREQQESAYLSTLTTQGYHIVGNYRLNDETTVYTLEK